ncbi:MAG: hydroxymethylbilane synthase [Planctomycetaceae bacterium]|nr:hydroxymethylbilane synthase [Planctomycetaceae bacterium]
MTVTPSNIVRIATRASALAMWQARHIASLIVAQSPATSIELVEISTTGDRVLSQPLRDFGGLGVFTREVQVAVLDGRADLAVHSLKDLPTETHTDLTLAAITERGLTADALVLPQNRVDAAGPLPLAPGAKVATGSPRRQAQLLAQRPDLELVEVRGNVETRLRKLDDGEFNAIILACAGLERLGLGHRISRRLSAPLMYPAVGQGAIGIECRANDVATRTLLASITHAPTWAAALAERALLAKLRAGCHAPVGVSSALAGSLLSLEAVVLTLDGRRRWSAAARGSVNAPAALGAAVADLLLQQGADVGR